MKLSIIVTFVDLDNLRKILENLISNYNHEIIVIDSDIYNASIADLCRKYRSYYLVVGSVEDKQYFDRVEDVIKGNWLAFLDGDCIPEKSWIDEISKIIIKYNPLLLGGPIRIKTQNKNIKSIAKKKWPIQLVDKVFKNYDTEIPTNIPIKMICSSNIVVKLENLQKLNQDKIRIGYIGKGVTLDENISLIGNGLFFSTKTGVTYEA